MGWERRAKRKHECNRPNVFETERKRAEVGDIWKCRKCGTRWELTYKGVYSETRAGPAHENEWKKLPTPRSPGVPRKPKPMLASPEPLIPAPMGRRTPPDLSWIQTETIHGSGRRTGPHPIDPPRQTGTDWLYSAPEGKA